MAVLSRSLYRTRPSHEPPGSGDLADTVEVDRAGTVHLFFDAPPESPTTRGFAGILHAGLDGLNAEQVLATPGEFSSQLGLADVVSPLRLRGLAAMLARIKRQVRQQQG